MGTMDGIIDTVSASHPILPLVGLLKPNGKLVLLGATEKPFDLHAFSLILGMHMTLISRELYSYVYSASRTLNKITP